MEGSDLQVAVLLTAGIVAGLSLLARRARWDAPTCFDDRTGRFGEEPTGLSIRTGSAIGPAEADREAAISALLTVRRIGDEAAADDSIRPGFSRAASARRDRRYREARLAPSDEVTVVVRLASAPDVPLLIAHGVPGVAAVRHQDTFVSGLLGALLVIGSAMGLALVASGGFGP